MKAEHRWTTLADAPPVAHAPGSRVAAMPPGAPTCAGSTGQKRRRSKPPPSAVSNHAADALVQNLLGFALDGAAPDALALAAIRDALDRAGLIAPRALDLALGPRPWETVFDGIAFGLRSESRARRGVPDDEPPAVAAIEPGPYTADDGADDGIEVVDAEPAESAEFDPAPTPDPPPRRRYVRPPVTGMAAIAEQARLRALPDLPPPRALPSAPRAR
jgi:hypothetical protein